MKRRIKIIIVSLLLLMAACTAAMIFWINPLLKASLEKFGSSALRTQLHIESVTVMPLRGSIKLKGIRLENPAGFARSDVLKINEALFQINLRSLRAPTFVIRRILIDQPELTIERNGDSDNLRALIELWKNSAAPEKEDAPDNPRRISINGFQVIKPRINFIQTEPEYESVSITAEDISFWQSASSFEVGKLAIHNPLDYGAPHLLSVEKIAAVVQCPHIGSVQLKSIFVDTPLLLREKGTHSDNLTVFRKHIFPFFKTAGFIDSAKIEEPPAKESAYSWRPFKVVVSNGKLVSFNPLLEELDAMRTELSFSQFACRPLEGVARIRQLVVANPRQFSLAHSVEIGEIQIGIDPASLGQESLRILEIQILDPLFAYERKLRKDNIAVLQHNMLVLAGKADIPDEEAVRLPEKGKNETPAVGIVVDHLLVRDGKVIAKLSKLPSAPISLPTIERFNLGEDGASYTTLTHEITGIIYQTILQSVSGIGGLAIETLKGSGNFILDTGGAVGNTAVDAIKGVGDLFMGSDD